MEFSVIDSIYAGKIPVKVLEKAIVVERDFPAPTGNVGTSYNVDRLDWSMGVLSLKFSSWSHDRYDVLFNSHKKKLKLVYDGDEMNEIKPVLAEYIYKAVSFAYKGYLKVTGGRVQTIDTAYCPTEDMVPARLLQTMLDTLTDETEFWANDFASLLVGKSVTGDEYYFIDDNVDNTRVFNYMPKKYLISGNIKNPYEDFIDMDTAKRIMISYQDVLKARSK